MIICLERQGVAFSHRFFFDCSRSKYIYPRFNLGVAMLIEVLHDVMSACAASFDGMLPFLSSYLKDNSCYYTF